MNLLDRQWIAQASIADVEVALELAHHSWREALSSAIRSRDEAEIGRIVLEVVRQHFRAARDAAKEIR